MRERVEHGQSTGPEVKTVDMAGSTSCRESCCDGKASQNRRLARPAGSHDEQVAVDIRAKSDHTLRLQIRLVAHPVDQLLVAATSRQVCELVDVSKLLQPRTAGRAETKRSVRCRDGRHDAVDVWLDIRLSSRLLDVWELPGRTGSKCKVTHFDLGCALEGRRDAADIRRLEHSHAPGTGLGDRSSGDRRIEVRRVVDANNV